MCPGEGRGSENSPGRGFPSWNFSQEPLWPAALSLRPDSGPGWQPVPPPSSPCLLQPGWRQTENAFSALGKVKYSIWVLNTDSHRLKGISGQGTVAGNGAKINYPLAPILGGNQPRLEQQQTLTLAQTPTSSRESCVCPKPFRYV